jgi:hypothetical protein
LFPSKFSPKKIRVNSVAPFGSHNFDFEQGAIMNNNGSNLVEVYEDKKES